MMERSLEKNQIGATVEENGVSVVFGEGNSVVVVATTTSDKSAELLVRWSENERNGLSAPSEDGLKLNKGISSDGNIDANDVRSVELETGDTDDAASVRGEGRLISISTIGIGQGK